MRIQTDLFADGHSGKNVAAADLVHPYPRVVAEAQLPLSWPARWVEELLSGASNDDRIVRDVRRWASVAKKVMVSVPTKAE